MNISYLDKYLDQSVWGQGNIVLTCKAWKSQKRMKKIAQVRESQGNLFSASLGCLDFEILWGSMPPDPPEGFSNLQQNLHCVMEKSVKSHGKRSGNSPENFLYTLCTC